MAVAICSACDKPFYWHGGRGAKLSDVLSPCHQAKGRAKSGDRKRSEKLDLPKIRADVGDAFTMYNALDFVNAPKPTHWFGPKTATVYLTAGGVLFSYPVGSPREVYTVDEQPTGEWRVMRNFDKFADGDGGYVSFRRILEEDYRALLNRAKLCAAGLYGDKPTAGVDAPAEERV